MKRALKAYASSMFVLLAALAWGTFTSAPSQAQLFLNMQSGVFSATNAANTKIVTGIAKAPVMIMQYTLTSSATGTVAIVYGTGVNCATGQTSITGAMQLSATSGPMQAGNGGGALAVVPPGNDVCIVTTGTATFGGHISYLQY